MDKLIMQKFLIGSRECTLYMPADVSEESSGSGSPDMPEYILVQPVDDNDLLVLEKEAQELSSITNAAFLLAAFRVNDWNAELSPWDAPAVFGKENFGHGAEETLRFIEESLLPETCRRNRPDILERSSGEKVIIGGYSLAAFFSLWAVYQTDRFRAAAAASPSVWFPGWIPYVKGHHLQTESVYLSLGDREEKARNPVMATVGDRIREYYAILQKTLGESDCRLEWNEGNHFRDSDLRCAKAFAWCMNHLAH